MKLLLSVLGLPFFILLGSHAFSAPIISSFQNGARPPLLLTDLLRESMRETERSRRIPPDDLVCHLRSRSLILEFFYPSRSTEVISQTISFNSGEVNPIRDPDTQEEVLILPQIELAIGHPPSHRLRNTVYVVVSFSRTTVLYWNPQQLPPSASMTGDRFEIPLANAGVNVLGGAVQSFSMDFDLSFIESNTRYPIWLDCQLTPPVLHINRRPYIRPIAP